MHEQKTQSTDKADALKAAQFLLRHGLFRAEYAAGELPAEVTGDFQRANVALASDDRLVLLANGGRAFWRSLQNAGVETPNPVDDFSRRLALTYSDRYLGDANPELLYPGDAAVPLRKLGELAGWSLPSPLGLALHPRFGPWFAYRALLKVRTSHRPGTVDRLPRQPAPCRSCVDKPCVASCPSGAVTAADEFGAMACATFRSQPKSPCAASCAARSACPVGAEFRYDDEQLAHHMRRSLVSIIRWVERGAGQSA